jgi:hypothetical protein
VCEADVVVLDVVTEEVPSDFEPVGRAVVAEVVLDVEVEVVLVVDPEVVVEVMGGTVTVVEIVGVKLVDVELVVLDVEVEVVLVVEVVEVPGTQVAVSESWVRSIELAGTKPPLTSASARACCWVIWSSGTETPW